MEKFFKVKERGSTVKREMVAGLTTFMTMAYILAVNPNILGQSGMDSGAVFSATAIASAIGCLCMALIANMPFVLSAGMGLNAYFTYTVVMGMGLTWQVALSAVFVEGVIFILLTLTSVREAVFNAIPGSIKTAITVGIGLFITFIGLQNAHVVVDSSTLVTVFSLHKSIVDGTLRTEGITVLLALLGTLITAMLVIKKVKGNILIGILMAWLLGVLCELTGIYIPNPEAGFNSVIPCAIISMPASVMPTFMQMDFSLITTGKFIEFFGILSAFLFVDFFDTIGTIIGCAAKANMIDEDGKLEGIRGALLADSIATTAGACLGTSTVTTFVESSAGIAEGGRTGLTSITAGGLFLLSLLFSPIFLAIPSYATAPGLIIVGFLMIQQITKINWSNLLEAIPCFIAITAMPFTYSISEGIAFGIISYTVLNTVCGNRDKVSILLWVLSILFILKYIFV